LGLIFEIIIKTRTKVSKILRTKTKVPSFFKNLNWNRRIYFNGAVDVGGWSYIYYIIDEALGGGKGRMVPLLI
jgi:hypothetical protein